jgi:adenylate cyclase
VFAVLEIERKFRVKTLPAELGRYPHKHIAQGYLADDEKGTQVRLRKADDRHTLTVKQRQEVGRIEHEVPLTAEWWSRLWPLTAGRRLTKTRFEVPYGPVTIEVDIFAGLNDGLVVAEVEFPDAETARTFQPPEWLGDDVTHDPHFSNYRRAKE